MAVLFCSRVSADNEAAAGTDEGAEQAIWTPKDAHFVFQGFTSKYSCDGLQAKVKSALLQLGARKDLRVEEGACERPGGGPEPFPNVNVKMNVLGLGESRAVDHGGEVVPAHWRMVDLRLDKDPLWQAEDCELLEQIKHTFLPLFATRKVDYHSECVPHQVAPGGTWLRAEVLVADANASQRSRSKP